MGVDGGGGWGGWVFNFKIHNKTKKILKIGFTNKLYFILFSFAVLVLAYTWLTKSHFARPGFTKLPIFLCSTNENSRSKTDLRENIFLLQDDKYNRKHTFF